MSLLTILLFCSWHAFHVSSTEIYYNRNGELEIMTIVFADDLENALNHQFQENIDILSTEEYEKKMDFIQRYLSQKFLIHHKDQHILIRLLGYEIQENRCFLYMETDTVTEEVSCSFNLLFDILPDQKNLILFTTAKSSSSFLLKRDQNHCILKLDP